MVKGNLLVAIGNTDKISTATFVKLPHCTNVHEMHIYYTTVPWIYAFLCISKNGFFHSDMIDAGIVYWI